MSFTFVIADLHGRYDLLMDAYARIKAYPKFAIPGDTVIHLGDYVDRGPESRQILEELQKPFWDGWNRIVLCGNHEQIMFSACGRPLHLRWWMQNGGGATLISYGQHEGDNANVLVVPVEHLRWIDDLPLMHVDKHRIYVHAGVDPDRPLADQEVLLDRNGSQLVTWKLYQDFDERGHGDYHVVHGHHQFKDGPLLKAGRTDLDTFAWYTGRLVVGVFDDDKPGGPIDTIEIHGDPA